MSHYFEIIAVALGVLYLLLAMQENILCWIAASISSFIFMMMFWNSGLLMSSLLQFYFLAMAVYGWKQWKTSNSEKKLPIKRFRFQHHIISITLILSLTIISGILLSRFSHAIAPFIDAFIAWGSIITTYMVTKKVLENWIYWIVIDTIATCFYFKHGLNMIALLFLVYTIIAVLGFFRWQESSVRVTS